MPEGTLSMPRFRSVVGCATLVLLLVGPLASDFDQT